MQPLETRLQELIDKNKCYTLLQIGGFKNEAWTLTTKLKRDL